MTIWVIVLWVTASVFGATAVAGLIWALRTRQFSDFARGATSIFDEEEPVGEATDAFPGEAPASWASDPAAAGSLDARGRGEDAAAGGLLAGRAATKEAPR